MITHRKKIYEYRLIHTDLKKTQNLTDSIINFFKKHNISLSNCTYLRWKLDLSQMNKQNKTKKLR